MYLAIFKRGLLILEKLQKFEFFRNVSRKFFTNNFMKTLSCDLCLKNWGLKGLKGALEKTVKAPLQVLDFPSVFDLWGL